MNITLKNRTMDGRLAWLIYGLLDLNDAIGCPFTLVIGDNVTWRNWHFVEDEIGKWDHESGRYTLAMWLVKSIKARDLRRR